MYSIPSVGRGAGPQLGAASSVRKRYAPNAGPLQATPQGVTPTTGSGPLTATPGLVQQTVAPPGSSQWPQGNYKPSPIPSSQPGGIANVNVPGATVSPYGPGNDLRGAMVTPSAGSNRSEIAKQRLDAFDTESAPMIRDQIRAVGQKAAQYGRLGLGETAIETLTPYTNYLSNRKALETRLAADTAEGQISDERSNRGELRGERDFEQSMSRQAIEDAFRQRQVESGEYDSSYNHALQQAALQGGVDPTAVYLGASGNASSNANQAWNGASAAWQAYLASRQQPRAS